MLEAILIRGHRNTDFPEVHEVRRPQPRSLPSSGDAASKGIASRDREWALIAEIVRAMELTGYPALRDIQVELERGIVMLRGRVPSYYQKQLAQVAARQVAGVRGIANGIEVDCGH